MEISRHWRLQQQRYGLLGEKCNHCGEKLFPPRDVCPECTQDSQELYRFSGKGEVYSYSKVFDPPAGYEGTAPYTMALVKLEEGPLVTAQLTDVDNDIVEIGMLEEIVTRKLREHGNTRRYQFIIRWI